MRTSVLLLILLLAPIAQAVTVLEDPVGDAETTVAGSADGGDAPPFMDLVSAAIEEDPDGFTFDLGLADVDAQPPEYYQTVSWIIAYLNFEYEGKPYAIAYERRMGLISDTAFYQASLHAVDPVSGDMDKLDNLETTTDESTDLVRAYVPRDRIEAADGRPVERDGVFTAFYAAIDIDMSIFGPAIPVPAPTSYHDRMPDEGFGAIEHLVSYGLKQSGHAALYSDAPYRVSNGEATTFLYEIEASNTGDDVDSFLLEPVAVPDAWAVTFPEGRLKLDGGESQAVPVLVTVPFNHDHGSVMDFEVHLVSQTDPDSVGRLQMGIRYTEVPQPAGHHDRLFIHTNDVKQPSIDGTEVPFPGALGDQGFMNTLEEDERGIDAPVHPTRTACGIGEVYEFFIPLGPRLEMGLDFDLDRTGRIDITMETPLPSDAFAVGGGFYVLPPGTQIDGSGTAADQLAEHRVASIVTSAPTAVEAGARTAFTLDILPEQAGDYVPYTPGANLQLLVTAEREDDVGFFACASTGSTEPLIVQGASMTLPLEEYHDDVEAYFQAASGVDLYGQGLLRRLVNPGDTVVFNITAENIGEAAATFDLGLTGNQVEWATLLGADSITLSAGETRPIAIALSAPASAADGTLADITLVAAKRDEDHVRSVLRMVGEVDVDVEHADEAVVAQELESALADDKQSPGLPLVALLAVLIGAARRRWL